VPSLCRLDQASPKLNQRERSVCLWLIPVVLAVLACGVWNSLPRSGAGRQGSTRRPGEANPRELLRSPRGASSPVRLERLPQAISLAALELLARVVLVRKLFLSRSATPFQLVWNSRIVWVEYPSTGNESYLAGDFNATSRTIEQRSASSALCLLLPPGAEPVRRGKDGSFRHLGEQVFPSFY